MRRIFLALVAFVLIQASCRKSSQNENGQLQLNDCLHKRLGNENVVLCFNALLEESRCPVFADCIWQGYALAKFTFKEGGRQHDVRLSTITMQGIPSRDTTISGYNIRLLEVLPYPGNTPEPTKVKVQITR